MLRLIRRLLGQPAKPQLPPFNFARNRYKAKKNWPPNLRELTEKQQFRFERKFKRRLRLKSIKPQWQKWTKIVQWGLIGFVIVYGVLFHDFAKDPMNPTPGEQPFKRLREQMKGLYGGMWTHTESIAGQERGSRRTAGAVEEGEEGEEGEEERPER
ncbi:hypothetical protein BU26DRAFT_527072 [Trematosphaeria pertusa]|uniref:Uncharacterized protein n=1 Tax=Trematosphaeria pertusa TaxID=390896 RepID=A0A6A6J5P2_9PLEO|nr:uncharacterized protein BU26DRAFT_527072 [Trematosphaeria pertusa]KAF2256803.1 hypothetical protein BU26DRAFT_527072 [Trematosphaeria pertusa]